MPFLFGAKGIRPERHGGRSLQGFLTAKVASHVGQGHRALPFLFGTNGIRPERHGGRSLQGFFDGEGCIPCRAGHRAMPFLFGAKGIRPERHGGRSLCRRFELFTGHKSTDLIGMYGKMGYKEYKKEIITPNVSHVLMEKQAKTTGDGT